MNLLELIMNADLCDLPGIVKDCGGNRDLTIADMLRTLALNDGPDMRELLALRLLSGLTQRNLKNPWIASAPKQDSFTGTPDCIFGVCPDTGAYYTLSYDDYIRHCYFAGASGFGKTNLMLLQQGITLARSGLSDPSINSIVPYSDLTNASHSVTFLSLEKKPASRFWLPYTKYLYIFDSDSLLYSPFQGIKKVPYRGLIERRLEILCTETEIRGPSRFLLMDVVMRLAENNGVFDGSNKYPSLAEVQQAVENLKFLAIDRRSRYRESILIRIGGLLSSCPKVFNCRSGLPIDAIDKVNFALELPDVATDIRRLLFSWLLFDLYTYRESAILNGVVQ